MSDLFDVINDGINPDWDGGWNFMPVAQSSHLQSYDYDPISQTLLITFVNGTIYRYFNVPETEYWNLQQSGGAGSYFHAKIRNNYSFEKIFDPRGA